MMSFTSGVAATRAISTIWRSPIGSALDLAVDFDGIAGKYGVERRARAASVDVAPSRQQPSPPRAPPERNSRRPSGCRRAKAPDGRCGCRSPARRPHCSNRTPASCPANSRRPSSGLVTPHRMRISVLLPAPLPPTRPSTSPRAMASEMSLLALVGPKDFVTPCSETRGPEAARRAACEAWSGALVKAVSVAIICRLQSEAGARRTGRIARRDTRARTLPPPGLADQPVRLTSWPADSCATHSSE